MELTIVKIDKKTLPAAHQKVAWQTLKDIDTNTWKEGIYDAKSQCFLIGFEPVITEWDSVFRVVHWKILT